ncbi:ABC transporter substrate-binding protein [Rhodococcus wratislaviensis]|uniref:SsuA/THI5-like domain-containing protein n=1 Tax=Rhodococcus wratislaviensis NBRC 100605 TaxID=1219028 RepID=X0Q9M8_RHOWR|nr:ABC transporter substrate-binding protein [Rhodococcus wratislaviensis]GAF47616.1 hypothetical protein RW1_043_00510 [Rhodococcus wratislaviensis NBRC 100605]
MIEEESMKRLVVSVAVACLTTLGLAACSGSGEAEESNQAGEISFNFATVGPTVTMLPFYVADEKGFFESEGIEPKYVTVASGAAMLSGFSAGQLDVIPTSLTAAGKLREGGVDAKTVAGFRAGLDFTIYSRKEAGLPIDGTFEEKMKALEGVNLGVQGGAEGSMLPFVKAMMREAGADPATLRIANVNFGGPQVAALRSGEVDAVITDKSTIVTADDLGIGDSYFSLLTDPPAKYQKLMSSGSIANGAFLSRNPEFAQKYVTAIDKTIAWMRDPSNLDEMHRISTQVQGVPESPVLNDVILPMHNYLSAYVDQSLLEDSLSFLYDSQQLDVNAGRLSVNDLFAESMIK